MVKVSDYLQSFIANYSSLAIKTTKLKSHLLRSEFTKNVLSLTTGRSIAQVIPILISPILTRLYTPADFGALALFLSIISIVSVICCGKYEGAIILREKDEDAVNVAAVAFLVNIVVSLAFLVFLLFFGGWFLKILNAQSLGYWIYLAPVTVFLLGVIL